MKSFDEFVGQIQVIDDRIDHHLAKAERLRDICDRVTTIWGDERIQTTRENTREQHLVELVDSRKELEVLLQERKKIYEEICSWMYGNLPADYASILIFRYIDRLKLSDIADRMGYVEQTVKNKSAKATKEARMIYERSTK